MGASSMSNESRDGREPELALQDAEAKNAMLVLDKVRPTVVVRRRVYEVEKTPANIVPVTMPEEEDVENGPPSSINVARALASLRADELARVEELVRSDDELAADAEEDDDPEALSETTEMPALESAPAASGTRRTVRVGKEISIRDLAARMEMSRDELVSTLVSNGFFSITPKSTLPRETAKVAAQIFGWDVTEADDEPASGKTRARKKSS